jgi:hypothetical protein
MTSRDQLEELAKRLKWLNDHAPNYSPGLMSSWIDNVRPELEKAESAIRSLLAQEPVGTIGEENFTQHVMVGVNGWHTLPGLRSVPILFKVLPTSTPLYAGSRCRARRSRRHMGRRSQANSRRDSTE